jgi:hypothetical protein
MLADVWRCLVSGLICCGFPIALMFGASLLNTKSVAERARDEAQQCAAALESPTWDPLYETFYLPFRAKLAAEKALAKLGCHPDKAARAMEHDVLWRRFWEIPLWPTWYPGALIDCAKRREGDLKAAVESTRPSSAARQRALNHVEERLNKCTAQVEQQAEDETVAAYQRIITQAGF